MFSMKFFNNKGTYHPEILKTVNNIINFISDKVRLNDTRIISDNSSIEVVSGKESYATGDEVIVELMIRKTIVINISDFKDKSILDEHVSKIKHFCEQAKNIEDLKYLPINMR